MDYVIKFLIEVKAHETMFKLCEKFGMVKTAAFVSVIASAPAVAWKLPDILAVVLK